MRAEHSSFNATSIPGLDIPYPNISNPAHSSASPVGSVSPQVHVEVAPIAPAKSEEGVQQAAEEDAPSIREGQNRCETSSAIAAINEFYDAADSKDAEKGPRHAFRISRRTKFLSTVLAGGLVSIYGVDTYQQLNNSIAVIEQARGQEAKDLTTAINAGTEFPGDNKVYVMESGAPYRHTVHHIDSPVGGRVGGMLDFMGVDASNVAGHVPEGMQFIIPEPAISADGEKVTVVIGACELPTEDLRISPEEAETQTITFILRELAEHKDENGNPDSLYTVYPSLSQQSQGDMKRLKLNAKGQFVNVTNGELSGCPRKYEVRRDDDGTEMSDFERSMRDQGIAPITE